MANTRNWIGLFILGTINNLPYVIVNSAAKTIADSFDKSDLVGLVFGANVALAVLVKALNTFVLLKTPYKIRFLVNGCLMLIGLFGVAFAPNFWLALLCIVVVGCSAAFGENVTLGFLSKFPSHLVNAWSSGTGMAGLFGSTIYIIFGCSVGNGENKTSGLRSLTKYAFLLTTPVVIVYFLAYFLVIKTDKPPQNAVNDDDDDETKPIINSSYGINDEAAHDHQESTPRRVLRCLKLTLWMAFNLCGVYVFEYVAGACAAKVRPKHEYNIGCPELYAALQLCYQAGVFVSRSSVQLFVVKRVEIFTVLQLANMILWLTDAHYKFIPVSVLPALMVFVGLLGGASYVNIFYQLLHDSKYPDRDRELCINITALFITLGICLGTAFETSLFTTVLKND